MTAHKPAILLLTDWYYPGYKAGGPIQSCVNLVNMLQDDYRFFVVTGNTDWGAEQPYPGIPVNQWLPGKHGEKIWYRQPGRPTAGEIQLWLKEMQPDIVYFNSMFSVSYTLVPLYYLSRLLPAARFVLAPRGMLHSGALRLKATKKKLFLCLFRLFGFQRRIVFQATDQQEMQDIAIRLPGARIVLAENIPRIRLDSAHPVLKEKGQLKLVFISRIHPKKNLHFLLNLLEEWKSDARVELDIYGEADLKAYEQECKTIAEKLPSTMSVQFRGSVSNELVFSVLDNYHVFVLPTRGENFGHAIFEALTSGKPVLLSDQTPWRNLEQRNAGWDIPLAAKDRYWIALDQLTAMDQIEYNKWSVGARKLAQDYMEQVGFRSRYQALFA